MLSWFKRKPKTPTDLLVQKIAYSLREEGYHRKFDFPREGVVRYICLNAKCGVALDCDGNKITLRHILAGIPAHSWWVFVVGEGEPDAGDFVHVHPESWGWRELNKFNDEIVEKIENEKQREIMGRAESL